MGGRHPPPMVTGSSPSFSISFSSPTFSNLARPFPFAARQDVTARLVTFPFSMNRITTSAQSPS